MSRRTTPYYFKHGESRVIERFLLAAIGSSERAGEGELAKMVGEQLERQVSNGDGVDKFLL